jgi:hypothetical protein
MKLLVLHLVAASALRVPLAGPHVLARGARGARPSLVRCSVADDDEAERERLRKLGEEAAAEAARLDAPDASDDLVAEFNARLAQEGGATQFRIKSEASKVKEGVAEATGKVQRVGADVADTAGSALNRLPPNLLPIIGVCVVLSALPSIFASIAASGGGGAYSV